MGFRASGYDLGTVFRVEALPDSGGTLALSSENPVLFWESLSFGLVWAPCPCLNPCNP